MILVPATSVPWGDAENWLMPESGGNARVAKTAQVYGSAQVGGDGDIAAAGDYLCIGPLGTRQTHLTLHRDRVLGIRVVAGCWHGSLDDFLGRLTDCPEHRVYREVVPVLYRVLQERMTPPGEER